MIWANALPRIPHWYNPRNKKVAGGNLKNLTITKHEQKRLATANIFRLQNLTDSTDSSDVSQSEKTSSLTYSACLRPSRPASSVSVLLKMYALCNRRSRSREFPEILRIAVAVRRRPSSAIEMGSSSGGGQRGARHAPTDGAGGHCSSGGRTVGVLVGEKWGLDGSGDGGGCNLSQLSDGGEVLSCWTCGDIPQAQRASERVMTMMRMMMMMMMWMKSLDKFGSCQIWEGKVKRCKKYVFVHKYDKVNFGKK